MKKRKLSRAFIKNRIGEKTKIYVEAVLPQKQMGEPVLIVKGEAKTGLLRVTWYDFMVIVHAQSGEIIGFKFD